MKPLFVISCPFDTFSVYGARSRDLVKAIIETDKYEVKLLSQRWGNTAYNALDLNNPDDKILYDLIWKEQQLPKQPDVWIQITVPNEFQPVGKYNIGITAGIETTVCDPSWLEGINRMNLTLVSSNHAKQVFQQSSFEKRNKQIEEFFMQVEGLEEEKQELTEKLKRNPDDTEVLESIVKVDGNLISANQELKNKSPIKLTRINGSALIPENCDL